MKKTKHSKTIWFNALIGVLALADYINPELLTTLGINDDSKVTIMAATGAVVAVVNLLLRFVTKEPINPPKWTQKK